MEFFCYHRDRPVSTPRRIEMVEEHWSYMDQFAASMIARGPTFTSDGTLTGSVHILDVPDPAAAPPLPSRSPATRPAPTATCCCDAGTTRRVVRCGTSAVADQATTATSSSDSCWNQQRPPPIFRAATS
ncbi:MAG: YciI family protein [Propionibacteriaceae bacterium]